jgi:hypothetical protein
MASEKGFWLETATHNKFWPLQPNRTEIFIEDIAIHLSQLSRYGGAVQQKYCVAEHSIHHARLCTKKAKLAGLMHDAHEALIGADIIRPVKRALEELAGFDIIKKLTAPIDAAIEKRFGFRFKDHAAQIHGYDNALLEVEAKVILHSPHLKDWTIPDTSGWEIEEGAFHAMRIEFLKAPNYEDYCRDLFLEMYEKARA